MIQEDISMERTPNAILINVSSVDSREKLQLNETQFNENLDSIRGRVCRG